MDANEFVKWLGTELQNLVQIPFDANRFEASCDLVQRAFDEIMNSNPNEQYQIRDELNKVPKSRKMGDYQIPYDIRDDYDTIEGVLATIEGFFT
jgi:hypothetical protein